MSILKRSFFLIVALSGWTTAETVQVISPLPLPITCVSGCGSGGGGSSSTTIVNVTTVTFNGISQPVNVTNITTTTISGTPNFYVVNPTTSSLQIQNAAGVNTSVGYQSGGSSVPVNVLNTVNVLGAKAVISSVTFTSSTPLNTSLSVAVTGYSSIKISIAVTGTLTGGFLNVEGSQDGGITWNPIPAQFLDSVSPATSIFPIATGTNKFFQADVSGCTNFRLRLSVVNTGSGSALIQFTPSNYPVSPVAVLISASGGILPIQIQTDNVGLAKDSTLANIIETPQSPYATNGAIPPVYQVNATAPGMTDATYDVPSLDLFGNTRVLASQPDGTQLHVTVDQAPAITVSGALGVQSGTPGSTLPDNQINQSFFTDSGFNDLPLATASWIYGGDFSGTADTARQGFSKNRTSTVFKTVAVTSSGNTAVWTPASGNKFRLLAYRIMVTENASQASGGVVTIKFQDATTDMPIFYSTYIPTTAVTTAIGDGYDSGWVVMGGFGIKSAAANNVLNINLSSTLATGTCRVLVSGTEE